MFKKIGLSTSIAMISLALSACGGGNSNNHSPQNTDNSNNGGAVIDTGNGGTTDPDGNGSTGGDTGTGDNGSTGGDTGTGDNGSTGGDTGTGDNGSTGGDTGTGDNGSTGGDTGTGDNGSTGGDTGTGDNGSTGGDTGTGDNGSTGGDTGSGDNGPADTSDPTNTDSGEYASEWEDTYPEVTPIETGTSLPGKFRIDALGNITEDGEIFPVRCGNWFGLDGQQEPKIDETTGLPGNNADGAPMELYIGNMWWYNGSKGTGRTLDSDMKQISDMGINMVRLPIAPEVLNINDPQGMGDASQKNGGALKNHPSVQQENALDGLKDFLYTADKYDVKVLLDVHSCSNYVGWRAGRLDAAPPWDDANRIGYNFTREDWSCNANDVGKQVTLKDGSVVTMNVHAYDEGKWLEDLQEIALLPASLGVDNVIGIDIYNEPWDYTWSEWSTLAEKAYNTINAVNNDLLIFVEGVGDKSDYGPSEEFNPNWGENLYGFVSDPLNIPKDRLVLAPHTYGPSVFVQSQFLDQSRAECVGLEGDEAAAKDCGIVIDPEKLRKGWHQHFGFLREQGYAIVVGEFGGNMDWPMNKVSQEIKDQWSHITTDVDIQWQNKFVNYMMDNNIHACYWSINPESADTYGWIKTKYDPIYNKDKWGYWGDDSGSIFDSRKTELLHRFWKYPTQ
ncbi:MAG: cellulase family glycosylhydrolase [Reinekea sp.]